MLLLAPRVNMAPKIVRVAQIFRIKDSHRPKELLNNLDLHKISHLKWSLHHQLHTVVASSLQLPKWVVINTIITKTIGIEIRDLKVTPPLDRVQDKATVLLIRIRYLYPLKTVVWIQEWCTRHRCHLRVAQHHSLVMVQAWTCSRSNKKITLKTSNSWIKALKLIGRIK